MTWSSDAIDLPQIEALLERFFRDTDKLLLVIPLIGIVRNKLFPEILPQRHHGRAQCRGSSHILNVMPDGRIFPCPDLMHLPDMQMGDLVGNWLVASPLRLRRLVREAVGKIYSFVFHKFERRINSNIYCTGAIFAKYRKFDSFLHAELSMKITDIPFCLVAAGLMLGAGGAEASVVNLIVNGSFEAGNLAGWTAASSNADTGGCNSGWTVSGSGSATGCSIVANPLGSKAAYQSFDGTGPKTRTLSQSFVVPELGSALLEFWDSYTFNIVLNKELPRSLDVNIVSGGISENVFHFLSPVGVNTATSAFTLQSVDLTDVLLKHVGETVQLAFVTTIPENFSGPAGLGLDNISLNLTDPVAAVPEPASLSLLGLGLAGIGLLRRRKA